MIRLDRTQRITRVTMTSWRSRTVGYGVCAYFVRGVLIDTGFPGVRGEFERLLDELRPRGVMLTHHHEDHAGNAEAVARRGIPLAASPATMSLIRARQPMGAYRLWCWGAMRTLESTVLPFDHVGLEWIATPGHSADHHAVWDPERESLFAGDLFLGVKVRVARPGEDPRTLVGSLRRAAALRPRMLHDAHRGEIADPVDALHAKADWLDEAIARIDRYHEAGWSDRAIARAVLGREEPVSYASLGDLSRLNLVRSVLASRGAPSVEATMRDTPSTAD